MAKQISVFLENTPGRLNNLLKALSDNEINICALAIADTGEYGITRLIAQDHDKAVQTLKSIGMSVSETDVLAIVVDNTPGRLYKATKMLADNNINVEYAYSALPTVFGKATLIVRVDDLDAAIMVLGKAQEIEIVEEF